MRRMMTLLALTISATLLGAASAQATDLQLSDIEQRLARLEGQLVQSNQFHMAGYRQPGGPAGCTDACGPATGGCNSCIADACCDPCAGGLYGRIEFTYLRATTKDLPPGFALEETYRFAPRFIGGYEDGCGNGVRFRYWTFDHAIENTSSPGNPFTFDWDVYDLEYTNRLGWRNNDIVFGAGVRFATTGINSGGVTDRADAFGLTGAIDGASVLYCGSCGNLSALYGGRLSLLQGDWDRDGTPLVGSDTYNVTELYLGVAYDVCWGGYDMTAQLRYEMQNWHSDFLAGVNGGNGYSVNFMGPSASLGVRF